jgi:hypothetical protein
MSTSVRAAPRAKNTLTVWHERVTVRQGDDALEVTARVYPDAGIVVLEKARVDGAGGAVRLIREIAVALFELYPETMEDARLVLYQPVTGATTRSRYLEWTPTERAIHGWHGALRDELVQLTGDRSLPK